MKFKNYFLVLQILLQLADLKAIKIEIGEDRGRQKEEPIERRQEDELDISSTNRKLNVGGGQSIFSIRNNNGNGKVVGKKKREQREASSSSTSSDGSNVFFGSGTAVSQPKAKAKAKQSRPKNLQAHSFLPREDSVGVVFPSPIQSKQTRTKRSPARTNGKKKGGKKRGGKRSHQTTWESNFSIENRSHEEDEPRKCGETYNIPSTMKVPTAYSPVKKTTTWTSNYEVNFYNNKKDPQTWTGGVGVTSYNNMKEDDKNTWTGQVGVPSFNVFNHKSPSKLQYEYVSKGTTYVYNPPSCNTQSPAPSPAFNQGPQTVYNPSFPTPTALPTGENTQKPIGGFPLVAPTKPPTGGFPVVTPTQTPVATSSAPSVSSSPSSGNDPTQSPVATSSSPSVSSSPTSGNDPTKPPTGGFPVVTPTQSPVTTSSEPSVTSSPSSGNDPTKPPTGGFPVVTPTQKPVTISSEPSISSSPSSRNDPTKPPTGGFPVVMPSLSSLPSVGPSIVRPPQVVYTPKDLPTKFPTYDKTLSPSLSESPSLNPNVSAGPTKSQVPSNVVDRDSTSEPSFQPSVLPSDAKIHDDIESSHPSLSPTFKQPVQLPTESLTPSTITKAPIGAFPVVVQSQYPSYVSSNVPTLSAFPSEGPSEMRWKQNESSIPTDMKTDVPTYTQTSSTQPSASPSIHTGCPPVSVDDTLSLLRSRRSRASTIGSALSIGSATFRVRSILHPEDMYKNQYKWQLRIPNFSNVLEEMKTPGGGDSSDNIHVYIGSDIPSQDYDSYNYKFSDSLPFANNADLIAEGHLDCGSDFIFAIHLECDNGDSVWAVDENRTGNDNDSVFSSFDKNIVDGGYSVYKTIDCAACYQDSETPTEQPSVQESKEPSATPQESSPSIGPTFLISSSPSEEPSLSKRSLQPSNLPTATNLQNISSRPSAEPSKDETLPPVMVNHETAPPIATQSSKPSNLPSSVDETLPPVMVNHETAPPIATQSSKPSNLPSSVDETLPPVMVNHETAPPIATQSSKPSNLPSSVDETLPPVMVNHETAPPIATQSSKPSNLPSSVDETLPPVMVNHETAPPIAFSSIPTDLKTDLPSYKPSFSTQPSASPSIHTGCPPVSVDDTLSLLRSRRSSASTIGSATFLVRSILHPEDMYKNQYKWQLRIPNFSNVLEEMKTPSISHGGVESSSNTTDNIHVYIGSDIPSQDYDSYNYKFSDSLPFANNADLIAEGHLDCGSDFIFAIHLECDNGDSVWAVNKTLNINDSLFFGFGDEIIEGGYSVYKTIDCAACYQDSEAPSNLPTKMRSDEPSSLPSVSPSVKESSAPSLTSSSIPTLVSSSKPSVSSSPTTRYVCPAMSVEYNLCLQRGNYQNKYDEVGVVKFAVSTVNNEYVWELRIENFVEDIVGGNILRRDTLENIKAYVGSSPPSSHSGSYNYKFTDSLPHANDDDLIAFGGLSCDNDVYFGVHLDADTGDTIWAIPCSDGSSADVPYEKFTEGWGGYSSYSAVACSDCIEERRQDVTIAPVGGFPLPPTSIPTAASVVHSVLGSDRPSLMTSNLPTEMRSDGPSFNPSSGPSSSPSVMRSDEPSMTPSNLPTKMRSDEPSLLASDRPSTSPSVMRSDVPSLIPTDVPTKMRSEEPSLVFSNQPSTFPSDLPSIKASSTPSEEASITPSIVRSDGPSSSPSNSPSSSPSVMRSDEPSLTPSNLPTKMRSDEPSLLASDRPSTSPSVMRSDVPSLIPTDVPTKMRSEEPSLVFSNQPSSVPSSLPSDLPSIKASITPSIVRSDGPSYSPSSTPSVGESSLPSLLPSMDPSNVPTKMRSDEPSSLPSVSPSVKESSAPSLTSSSIPTLVSSSKPSVSSSPTTRYVCPAMSVEYNLCLQRGNYQNKYDEVGVVKFAVSTVNNEYVWELRIENFVEDIVGGNILRRDTLENIKAYVGSSPPSSHSGSYNYKFTDSLPHANDDDLIAFGGLSCDNDVYFGVHLDADTGDTIWAIPCSDGSSADVPYEKFTEGWGGYSSYSAVACSDCIEERRQDVTIAPVGGFPLPPTSIPTAASVVHSVLGSDRPSLMTSNLPTEMRSDGPSFNPSSGPSSSPSVMRSDEPSMTPSNLPTKMRSDEPSLLASDRPSTSPSVMRSDVPSLIPTDVPTKMRSEEPSLVFSNQPSTFPSDLPSIKASSTPSEEASITPSIVRSDGPSSSPSNSPSSSPSVMRSDEPSLTPSNLPTKMRSDEPSLLASDRPSTSPSVMRSDVPSLIPTDVPTKMRSEEPSLVFSNQPSSVPSSLPSDLPSIKASITPSIVRSDGPSYSPSSTPSVGESSLPSLLPSMDPSNVPTKMRSDEPSSLPSVSPSVKESSAPSLTSSSIPTLVSSSKPSVSSSPTTRYVCPAMSVEYNLCLQRGNYQNKYDEVGVVKFAVSTVNNEYVWELRIENFVEDIVGGNILRRDTLENIKAYVGSSPPSSNAGSYNYKFTDSLPYANDADLIAFGGLSCDNDVYFGVHLDGEPDETIWAIPCSDGSSADVPYEQFSEGWGGYSSFSTIDCHHCTDLLLENSIFRRRLFSDEKDNIYSENSADFECLFEENDISCPYCLSCLGQCDDECGFYSYPSEEDLLSCLENMIPECADKCSDVCNGHFIDHIFASSSEDDNAFNMNPYDSSNHSNPSATSTDSSSEMICSAQDMNQNACPYCDTCLAACDDECGFYTSASVEEWTTCFENLSDECVNMCKDVCRKEFLIEVK